MTREEAIADIRDNIKPIVGGKSLDMAIEALEQEPCADAISRQAVLEKAICVPIARVVTEDKVIYRKIVFVDEIENIPPVIPAEKVEQCEPCTDAISRQAAIDALDCINGVEEVLKSLSPVKPAEKVGRWIPPQWDDGMSDPIYYQVRCSECGFDLDPQTFCEELKKYGADRFCPKCGAKMQEVKE